MRLAAGGDFVWPTNNARHANTNFSQGKPQTPQWSVAIEKLRVLSTRRDGVIVAGEDDQSVF